MMWVLIFGGTLDEKLLVSKIKIMKKWLLVKPAGSPRRNRLTRDATWDHAGCDRNPNTVFRKRYKPLA